MLQDEKYYCIFAALKGRYELGKNIRKIYSVYAGVSLYAIVCPE
jgi:hypothetical protein